jgi:hypothetical protein
MIPATCHDAVKNDAPKMYVPREGMRARLGTLREFRYSISRSTMWPDPIRTSQLLKQAERGDDDAVSQLLQQHRDPLWHAVGLRLDHALARRVDELH